MSKPRRAIFEDDIPSIAQPPAGLVQAAMIPPRAKPARSTTSPARPKRLETLISSAHYDHLITLLSHYTTQNRKPIKQAEIIERALDALIEKLNLS